MHRPLISQSPALPSPVLQWPSGRSVWLPLAPSSAGEPLQHACRNSIDNQGDGWGQGSREPPIIAPIQQQLFWVVRDAWQLGPSRIASSN